MVMCGMGPYSVLQILLNDSQVKLFDKLSDSFNPDKRAHESNGKMSYKLKMSSVDDLDVQKIIVQPWPPNILSWLTLSRYLLNSGWLYCEQGIDQYGAYQHLTTSFVRRSSKDTDRSQVDFCNIENVFLYSPIISQLNSGSLEEQDKRILFAYLSKQKYALLQKLKGVSTDSVTKCGVSVANDLDLSVCRLDYRNTLNSLITSINELQSRFTVAQR